MLDWIVPDCVNRLSDRSIWNKVNSILSRTSYSANFFSIAFISENLIVFFLATHICFFIV